MFVVITVAALIVLIVLNATDISLDVKGIILMTVSTFFFACQNVSARYVRGVFKPIEITAYIAAGGTVVFVAASLVRACLKGNLPELLEPLRHMDFVIWISFRYLLYASFGTIHGVYACTHADCTGDCF